MKLVISKKDASQFSGNVYLINFNMDKYILLDESSKKLCLISKNNSDFNINCGFNIDEMNKVYLSKTKEFLEFEVNEIDQYFEIKTNKITEKIHYSKKVVFPEVYQEILKNLNDNKYIFPNYLNLDDLDSRYYNYQYLAINSLYCYVFNYDKEGNIFYEQLNKSQLKIVIPKAFIDSYSTFVFSLGKQKSKKCLMFQITNKGYYYLEVDDMNTINVRTYDADNISRYQNIHFFENEFLGSSKKTDISFFLDVYDDFDDDIKVKINDILNQKINNDRIYGRFYNNKFCIYDAGSKLDILSIDNSYNIDTDFIDVPKKLFRIILNYKKEIEKIYKFEQNDKKIYVLYTKDGSKIICKK